jgi:hypothetical protein
MTALIIGPSERAVIKAAIERARRCPINAAEVARLAVPDKFHVTIEDRVGKRTTSSQHVVLPNGYFLAICFEDQPDAGLCIHISISVRGGLPNPWAAEMIATACGVPFRPHANSDVHFWIEDFEEEGGRIGKAINMIYAVA